MNGFGSSTGSTTILEPKLAYKTKLMTVLPRVIRIIK